jgi:hypothetical protein
MKDLVFFLALLQLKHWYVDFVNQTMEEVKSKGQYGDRLGLWHSAKHGIGTAMAVWIVGGFVAIPVAILVGLVDFAVHYHVDWAKMNWGNRDINDPLFWNHLGLDQMVHQLTYIIFMYWLFV